jgi:Mn-dependent DtxR family transcriptional regulator
MSINIHESAENYLEAILALGETGHPVRSIDVAQHLGFSKPSVSRAMSLLREGGFVAVDAGGFLRLTDDGMEIAQRIYERHLLLTKWLVHLGVSEDVAVQDACRIEHDLSVESFDALREHINRDMGLA